MMLSRAGRKDLDDVGKGGAVKSHQELCVSALATSRLLCVWPLAIDSFTLHFRVSAWKQRILYFAGVAIEKGIKQATQISLAKNEL